LIILIGFQQQITNQPTNQPTKLLAKKPRKTSIMSKFEGKKNVDE
jgi:hypothetical protein